MERLELGTRQFTQADVLSILPRLTGKTLQNWRSRGIFDGPQSSIGKGNRHLYTGYGVVMLSFMEQSVRRLKIDPSDAAKLAQKVALCAQQLWDLQVDELAPNGMREIPPLAADANDEYRRGFIYDYDNNHLRMMIGRKDPPGSLTPRFYSVVAVDLINLNVINLINRHVAGIDPTEVHIYSRFDERDDCINSRRTQVLSKIRTLPVDEWDGHA